MILRTSSKYTVVVVLVGTLIGLSIYLAAPPTPPAQVHSEPDYFQEEMARAARQPPLLDVGDMTGHISDANLASIRFSVRELNASLIGLAALHRARDKTTSIADRRTINAQAVGFRIEADRQKHAILAVLSPGENRWFHGYVEGRAQSAGLTHDVWSIEEEGESRGVLRGAGEHAPGVRDSTH